MLEKFLEYLSVEKRYSENTLMSYRKDLEDFQSFYMDTEGASNIRNADKKIIRNFMVEMSSNCLSKRTINRKLSSLRSFYKYLLTVGEISSSPVETIKALKFYPEKQIPFSMEEMEKLEETEVSKPILERLIIEILYQTGMRKSELCGLLLENVSYDRCEIKVKGKGNKERIIPISEKLRNLFQVYHQEVRGDHTEQPYFLLSKAGKKLGPKFVYSVVNSYLSTVTTKIKKSPHILRHTFATHILNEGAEVSKVQKLMGHSSLASTQVYTNADIDVLKKVFNKAHPRAKK